VGSGFMCVNAKICSKSTPLKKCQKSTANQLQIFIFLPIIFCPATFGSRLTTKKITHFAKS